MKIYEKIKKLLSLANSENENEAKLATEKANELMIKYNLSVQDVEEKQFQTEQLSERKKAITEDKYILSILKDHFFVSTYFDYVGRRSGGGTKSVLVGTPENVEIAVYVYDFLLVTFKALWVQDKKQNGSTSKQSFYLGLYKGLNKKLIEKRKKVEQQVGLVVVPDAGLQKFMREQVPNLRERTNRVNSDSETVARGKEAGKNITISKGLGGSSSGRTYLIGKG